MSLRNRLRIILLLLALCSASLAAVTAWATVRWRETDRQIQEHFLRSLALQEVRAQTFRAFKELPDALFGGDPDARAEFDRALSEVGADFQAWLAAAETEDERHQHAEVHAAFQDMIRAAKNCFDLLASGQRDAAYEVMESELEAHAFAEFDRLTDLASESDARFRETVTAQATRVRTETRWALVIVALGSMAVLALGIAQVASDIFRPLREIERALHEVGRGDFTSRIVARDDRRPGASRDELGVLVRTFNEVVQELSRTTVSKSFVDSVVDSLGDALLVVDLEARIVTGNAVANRLFHSEKLAGRELASLFPPDARAIVERACAQAAAGEVSSLELVLPGNGVAPVTLGCTVAPQRQGPAIAGLLWLARDISQRTRDEEVLRAALAEKEMLLREINHRVKNNLQIISSLLNLQRRGVAGTAAAGVLEDSRNRILAMALIHDRLYRAERFDGVELPEYLADLTGHLAASLGAEARGIVVRLDVAPVALGLDTAIPCGLIVNELVTNAFKHAFPGGARGEIHVALRVRGDELQLAVRDDGRGLADSGTTEPSTSLGLRLVAELAGQLLGRLETRSAAGTECVVSFPRPHPAHAR